MLCHLQDRCDRRKLHTLVQHGATGPRRQKLNFSETCGSYEYDL
jgi:hypothetical protein